MNIILLENIRGLGALGDTVAVKAGYGRNFLIPKGKAVPATADNQAYFNERRAELEKKAAELFNDSKARADRLNETEVSITAKAGDEGKLFGSIGTRDIAEAISETGIKVDKREVKLPEGPLRSIGEYEIAITVHADISATVKLTVLAEA